MLDLHRSLQNTSWRRALNIEREKSRRVVRLRHLPVLPGESTPPRAVVRSRFHSTPTAESGTPLLPLAMFWPSSSLLTRCASYPTSSFLCRRCCARRVIAAPVLPAEGEMTWHGCSALLPCACSSAPSLHVLQHGSMLAANRPAPLSLRFVFYG